MKGWAKLCCSVSWGREFSGGERKEGVTCLPFMLMVSLWCHQQGQGEFGGRSLVVGKVGKVVCGVHHQREDQKGGGK